MRSQVHRGFDGQLARGLLLASYAVLTVVMLQVTRLLLGPACIPGEIALAEHDHVAA
jgi:hypothetical protein